jgi:DedD protein
VDRAQFKQRIVGAIVLVALGVIFIPIILNQETEESPIRGTNIPVKPATLQELADQQPPAIPAEPVIDTNRPRLVDEHTPPVEQTDASSDRQDTTGIKDTPSKKSTPAPTPVETPKTTKQRAWVVQVASFSERSKALKLRDRLRKSGYTAFVESVSMSKGTLYRVRVGPVVKREKADSLRKKIIKEFKIKDALVMSHP